MNAYETAQRLNITGTPEQIVDKLKLLTVADIPIMSVRTWFREKSLWLQRSTGEMFGPLQTAYDVASQPQKDGLDYLYDTVFAGSAQYLRTTDPVWAAKVWELVQLVVTLSPQASGLVDSFYALDGGRPFKDLTEAEYSSDQTAYETAQAARAALLAIQNRRQAWDTLSASIRSQIESGALADDAAVLAALTTEFGG